MTVQGKIHDEFQMLHENDNIKKTK